MSGQDRAELSEIKRFDQLVRYLRDRMGWPIGSESFEELTFEYTPEELGIDLKNAAKIQEIKRLRPLVAKQPWGIFFVKFEPRKLPVVALRRILGQVALKKRASANSSERAAWAADDLLFVSNYGEGDERKITFAHFSKPAEGQDLPTLKVLGWDNLDTALHLDDVAKELTEHLSWPQNDGDVATWGQQWRSAFALRHKEVITTSKDLSVRLAELARAIRDRIKAALAIETDKGPLTRLLNAFQAALVQDLDASSFADMYAQTIAYGLLSARIAEPRRRTADDFAAHMRTSPFLRELMETFLKVGGRRGKAGGSGIDFDELGVSDVVDLLDTANMEAVVRDFGDRNRDEDPVMHFYELFLHEYDRQLKIQRGVFYTPQPVVSYIVRSVHELLQTEVGLADGLADITTWGEMLKRHPDLKLPPLSDEPGEKRTISPDEAFVQILDPATGTATFLVEVIEVIYRTLTAKWTRQGLSEAQRRAAWNEYVPEHLLKRLHAYELMMAPYAIAHMKIGLKLAETGYKFGTEERARIYLTSALEPCVKQLPLIGFDALAREAAAVNEIKRHKRFTVVLGNPPYSVLSSNNGAWIQGLLADFRKVDGQPLGERNSQSLQDDYVKFFRLVTHCICGTGMGVVGFITPHGFLDNPTFRGMRQQLTNRFTKLRFLDLHGNANRKEKCPDGSPDENVFDILQGTAISILSKTERERVGDAAYAELWGSRDGKYRALSTNSARTVSFVAVAPQPPHFLLVPRNYGHYEGFSKWPPITDLMPVWSNGLMTSRDDFVFAFSDAELLARVRDFAERPLSEGKERYGLRDVREMSIKESQAALRRMSDLRTEIKPCLYRPMDVRPLFYHQCLVRWPAFALMREMCGGKSLGLVTSRMTKGETFAHVMATRHPVEKIALSSKTSNNAYLFPLVVHRRDAAAGLFSEDGRASINLSSRHMVEWFRRMGLTAEVAIERDGNPNEAASQVFSYFFALLHSPTYRSQYAEFLRGEFPRLPLTGNMVLFQQMARFGTELIALNLLESPKLAKPISEFISVANSSEIEKISWSRNTVWINKTCTAGFQGVPEDVWSFQIGGYQVCEKWLKDRKGRKLLKGDVAHYHKIVVALSETIRLMAEIDSVVERHGGWPGAFKGAETGSPNVSSAPSTGSDNVVRLRDRVDEPIAAGYELLPSTLLKAAEPVARKIADEQESESTGDRPRNLDDSDPMSLIRQLFADGQPRNRESAIRDMCGELGHERVGPRVREDIDDAIRTAVRRGILANEGGDLRINARTIEGYDRAFLKDQFLASLEGRRWTGRDDAIRGFARWLGFRRTGPAIDEMARSLINGLLRDERLEANGDEIRRSA